MSSPCGIFSKEVTPLSVEVVVVGGGYAGLAAIGALQNIPDVRVQLIEPGSAHELIPELPEALAAHGAISQHVVAYADILDETRVQHLKTAATGIQESPPVVLTADGGRVPYDWLILASGSSPSMPPIPGLQQYGHPLRNAADTARIKEALQYHKAQRVAVVGGGLTGVEVAGMLAADHDVILIEAARRLLPALGRGLAEYAHQRLLRTGVNVVLGQKVQRVEEHAVVLDRDQYGFDVLVWAGGIAVPEWIRDTKLNRDNHGFPIASPIGQVAKRIFVAGDLWHITVDGKDVPATAQVATIAGHYVGTTIGRLIQGKPLESDRFSPRLRGMLISLDPGQGVGWVLRGGIPVRGLSARALKELSFRQYRLKLARTFPKS